MQLFETKKSEKSPYTRGDAEEPPNFHAAGTGQPNPASAADKKERGVPPVSLAAQSSCLQQQGFANLLGGMIKTLGHSDLIVLSKDKKTHPFNAPNQVSHCFCLCTGLLETV